MPFATQTMNAFLWHGWQSTPAPLAVHTASTSIPQPPLAQTAPAAARASATSKQPLLYMVTAAALRSDRTESRLELSPATGPLRMR